MSLSVAETADKASITNFITTLPKTGIPSPSSVTFYGGLDPPSVCSDGIRRPNVLDYIDYLFQSPTIEQVIKTYLGTTTTYSITLRSENNPRQFSAIVKNTGNYTALAVRSITSPGATLPATLTLATQVTLTSGTTFTNASSSTGQKWDSGFSSALPLSTGYITATPGAFITTGATTLIQVGLSTSALVVPGNTGNPTSYSVSYGFYVLRNPATPNSTTPGAISLYKIVPGASPGTNPIQLGNLYYATAPALTVSYDGQYIRYSINGVPATHTVGGGSSAVAVSLSTLYATGLFAFSGDSLTSVVWGSSVAGPQGLSGVNGNAGIQGTAGPTGPQGPGFTTIGGTATSGNLLLANGTTNSAYAQSGLAYGSGVLASSAMRATNGAMTAAISSTVSGTIPSGFLSYSNVGISIKAGATNTVLSGLSASGLYVCSAIGNTGSGSTITQFAQFYIVKIPTTGYFATQISASPATASTTIRWGTTVGTTSFSITLYNSGLNDQTINLGITLLANTVNFS